MKRYVRFCLIFLISLALPLSGMAGVQASTEPCPMKTMGIAMMGKRPINHTWQKTDVGF
ncbi:hypothetical protein GIV66_30220 [Pseudomonas sp. PA-3-11C]|nr:hypothetical protein [Pseudomonas sp. PA-3-6H]MCF5518227.1 hypothetical protein [Pseudomonas sp. PA-3-6E]MCF5565165.1 hypothetical protein [Pseudomonas sp. PA-3-5D]MCF5571053.1 hypothetical protein [Pseudomonas sp. PA-3-11C]MCF5597293.1 hypothetical protein [Pseudomonas sp. PA-3-10C]